MRLTPVADDLARVMEFRRVLDAAGYTLERIRPTLLTLSGGEGVDGTTTTPLDTLVRLFFVRTGVTLAAAERALAPLSVATCAALGLITVHGDQVAGAAEIVPVGELLFASDGDTAEPARDHVMSPAGSTRLLAALTVRHQVQLALDLGTGCGYQAILAAPHSTRVIATDMNPRALAFATFNAALNGLDNIECRCGDWFDAVGDLGPFDLIVCNPPYVLAPDQSVLYRDAGDPATGGSSRRLIQAASGWLNPGGIAHILTGWTYTADAHWSRPLLDWVSHAGCDAWVLRYATYDPPTYAATWNAHLANHPPRYAEAIQRWTRAFAEQGIQRLAEGAVILRRRTSGTTPALSVDELTTSELDPSAGAELAARMTAIDRLDQLDDTALVHQRLEVTPHQRLDQTLRYHGERFHLDRAVLVSEHGLRTTQACSPLLLRLLSAVNGQRTVGELLEATAPTATATLGAATAPSPTAAALAAATVPNSTAAALAALRQAIAHNALRFA